MLNYIVALAEKRENVPQTILFFVSVNVFGPSVLRKDAVYASETRDFKMCINCAF